MLENFKKLLLKNLASLILLYNNKTILNASITD